MRIAIVGGTGTLGRLACDAVAQRGDEPRALSRHSAQWPVDLRTGAGLERALEGCEAVIDASNDNSRSAARTLVEGTRRLLQAEAGAGVRHHVCVSIVGCDAVPIGYYRIKVAQERTVESGPVPATVVRATQFHELLDRLFRRAARWRLLPLPRALLQPIACAEVAAAVAEIAAGAAVSERIQIAGPQVAELRALASRWTAITGHHLLRVPLWVPGTVGTTLRSGALTALAPDRSGRTSFETWLESRSR